MRQTTWFVVYVFLGLFPATMMAQPTQTIEQAPDEQTLEGLPEASSSVFVWSKVENPQFIRLAMIDCPATEDVASARYLMEEISEEASEEKEKEIRRLVSEFESENEVYVEGDRRIRHFDIPRGSVGKMARAESPHEGAARALCEYLSTL